MCRTDKLPGGLARSVLMRRTYVNMQTRHVPDNRHVKHSGVTFPLLSKLQIFTRDAIITDPSIDILLHRVLENKKAGNKDMFAVPNYSHTLQGNILGFGEFWNFVK